MATLTRHPEEAVPPAEQAPADLPPTPEPEAPVRLCGQCAAGMQAGQDWCLECGTAAPGRLGGLRPGWRAVTTTLAATLVLVGGAGAASYAALSSDANREAAADAPLDGTPVAQAPPAVPAPAAPVVPGTVVPPATPPAAATPPAKLPTAPKVTPLPPVVNPPTPPAPSGDSDSDSGSDSGSDDTAAGPRGEGTAADTDKTRDTTPLEPIKLADGAARIYDPYKRAVQPGDPARATDGSADTSLALAAPADGREMQVGVVVDLGSAKQVRGVELDMKTQGGRIEVYATDSSALPPDILDTRWDHPASRKDAGRTERIVFPKGGSKYRYVTFWFTSPPKAGPKLQISELRVVD